MITALLVVADARFGEQVVVSAEAAGTGGGGLDLAAGERYSVGDLLYALLLTSSNDAAVALAEHVATTEAAFVRAMNRFARRLGADRTHFVTAHGLDQPRHYSTATDLVLVANRMLEHPVLASIVATPSTVISTTRGAVELENRNPLLETYRGAVGVKTGYTAGAGNVLVFAAERAGRRLVGVVMRTEDPLSDSVSLLDYGFRSLSRSVLVSPRSVVGAIVFDPAGATSAIAAGHVRGLADPEEVDFTLDADGIAAPVTPGEPVGEVTVSWSGRVLGQVDAIAQDHVERQAESWATEALARLLRTAALLVGKL